MQEGKLTKSLWGNSHAYITDPNVDINERTNEVNGDAEMSLLRAVAGNRMTDRKRDEHRPVREEPGITDINYIERDD
jgi:hypothetical protein